MKSGFRPERKPGFFWVLNTYHMEIIQNGGNPGPIEKTAWVCSLSVFWEGILYPLCSLLPSASGVPKHRTSQGMTGALGYSHFLVLLVVIFQAAPELARNFLKPLGISMFQHSAGYRCRDVGWAYSKTSGNVVKSYHHPPFLHFKMFFVAFDSSLLIRIFFPGVFWRTLRAKRLLPINGGENEQ